MRRVVSEKTGTGIRSGLIDESGAPGVTRGRPKSERNDRNDRSDE